MPDQKDFLWADWPAPANIHALTTTRSGGVSQGDFSSLNLADHVNDVESHVQQNRQQLCDALNIKQPIWLKQVHGMQVVSTEKAARNPQADAVTTNKVNDVCAVMTADCLPLLFCNRAGTKVAAAHAGWRGLAEGVIEATIDAMQENPENIMVWLGPAIGPEKFEVGRDVFDAFVNHDKKAATAFKPVDEEHYLADIYQLATLRLQAKAIEKIYGGSLCTFTDEQRFFSFRRNAETGRMASLIWMSDTE